MKLKNRVLFKLFFTLNTHKPFNSLLKTLIFQIHNYSRFSCSFGSSQKPSFSSKKQIWSLIGLQNLQRKDQFISLKSKQDPLIEKQKDDQYLGRCVNFQCQRLTENLTKLAKQISQSSQKTIKILAQTDIKLQSILKQIDVIVLMLSKFKQFPQEMSQIQLEERINFVKQINEYIDRDIKKQSPIFSHFKRVFLTVKITVKIKGLFAFFKFFDSSPSIIHSHSVQSYSRVWDKIQYYELLSSKQIQKQYNQMQLIIHILTAAMMNDQDHPNPFLNNLYFIKDIVMSAINCRQSLLKSLQFHYKGNIQTLIQRYNAREEIMIEPIMRSILPQIQTNFMIYIPLNQQNQNGWDIFQQSENSIPVRVLYYKPLPLAKQQEQGQIIQDLVVHMHGGGYVAFSSHASEVYTRLWANYSKIPIFSVDYRLAPKYSFPVPTLDSLRVYQFITKNIHKYFKINPKNIFVGGDSAGGNLACGMTALVLQKKIQIPKGLFLIYPSLDIRGAFYGSRKQLINDPILWPSIIKVAFDYYLPVEQDHTNQLASPLLLTEEFVGGEPGDLRFPLNWPRTEIQVGAKDPLRDQCIILMQKMVESNIDCKCTIISDLRHGYINTELAIISSKGIIQKSSQMFREFIESFK